MLIMSERMRREREIKREFGVNRIDRDTCHNNRQCRYRRLWHSHFVCVCVCMYMPFIGRCQTTAQINFTAHDNENWAILNSCEYRVTFVCFCVLPENTMTCVSVSSTNTLPSFLSVNRSTVQFELCCEGFRTTCKFIRSGLISDID